MAVSTIAYKPNLTKSEAREIFRRHFEGTYRVEDWKGPPIGATRDFALIKSAFVGVGVKLEQSRGETKFVFGGYSPNRAARAVSSLGLLGAAMSFMLWNGATNEVKRFIESAAEFH
jgi:hypothetical protein